MAAGIAHELRQPLTVLYGVAEHMKLTLDRNGQIPEEQLRERADSVLAQAERMEHIIERVRVFAREAGKPNQSQVQVNDVVRSAVDMVTHTYRSKGIELVCELAQEPPNVNANAYSLEEVLLNLLSNSRDAVESRAPGRVQVETHVNGSAPRPDVVVTVTDNGVGVPAAALERVFDPFYTTKNVDRGTGLGLSVCRSLIEEMGGRIQIQSTEATGSVVSVRLPAAAEPAA